jgi:hypothetical protein
MALVKEKCRIMPGSFNTLTGLYWNYPLYVIERGANLYLGIITLVTVVLFLVGVLILTGRRKSFIDTV